MKQKLNTIGIVLMSLAGMLLIFVIFIGFGNYFQSIEQNVLGNMFIILFLIATYFGVKLFNRKVNLLLPGSYGFHFKNFGKNILIGAIIAIIITALALIVANICLKTPFEFVALKHDYEKPLVILIISTIGIGIWEEFYFRGLIYNTLVKNSFGFHISALVSSILFSVIHWSSFDMSETSWVWYIGIVFIGYILVFIYTITKSIWSVVSFHFIWNFMARLLDNQENEIGLFEIPNFTQYSKTLDNIMVVILGLTVLLIIFLTRKKTVSDKIKSYVAQINISAIVSKT